VGQLYEAQSVRLRYGLVVCLPPGRTDLGLLPAAETFTPELSPDKSPPSSVRYHYSADRAICAGGTHTRKNNGLLGRTLPQLTDWPSLHATSSTPERFRAAPESTARTAAFAHYTQARPARSLTGNGFDAAEFTQRCSLQLCSLSLRRPDFAGQRRVHYRAPLAACPDGTLTHWSFSP